MADRSWWMAYFDSAEAIRFMPFTRGSAADCTQFIQWALDRIARDGSGLNAIIDRFSNKPLGMVGLLTQEVDGVLELEIGYHLLPDVWGHGYATEAAIACKEFVWQHTSVESVVSLIDPGNTGSEAVAKRNGMRLEKHGMHRGEEVMVYRVQRPTK